MISRIEALDYRSLRDLSLSLGSFHVLVGPNESGKTSFFDIFSFLGTLASEGVGPAIAARTDDFRDLVWRREGHRFELAIEALIPEERRSRLPEQQLDTIRYEMALGLDPETGQVGFLSEKVLLKQAEPAQPAERAFFPFDSPPRKTLLTPKTSSVRTVVHKVPGKNDNYYSEVYRERGKGWAVSFQLGPRKSALGALPGDESKFPATTWFKSLLTERIHPFMPSGVGMRLASPPGQGLDLKPGGSNLPWVVSRLNETFPERFNKWVEHLKTALPDMETLRTIERPEDKHCYLVIRYRNGLEVPSWSASHGTLRLLALTLPAFLPEFSGVYLVEEPENGIHPRAVKTLFQSLSSVSKAQILVTTHSPVVLSAAEPRQVLCFAKTQGGATDVIAGHEHPVLKEWQGERNLGVLFAEGVLG